jgi:hypothetical protein
VVGNDEERQIAANMNGARAVADYDLSILVE